MEARALLYSSGGKQALQCLPPLRPCVVALVKNLWNAAPAHVLGKNFLLRRACRTILRFQQPQRADGLDVAVGLDVLAAFAKMVVEDAIVPAGSGA